MTHSSPKFLFSTWGNLHITEATQKSTPIPVAISITLYGQRYRSNSAVYHPLLLYCCFFPPLGLSSVLFQLFCHCVEGDVIWHFQLSEVLKKPGLLQERDWKCLFGLLIALAGWNPFNLPWTVNCPFPFPSDQGGMIRLTADQSYYQHRVLCLKRPLWPLGEFSLTKTPQRQVFWQEIESTFWEYFPIREYFPIWLRPPFWVTCQTPQKERNLQLEAIVQRSIDTTLSLKNRLMIRIIIIYIYMTYV